MTPARIVHPVSYAVQRGAPDASPVQFRVLNGTQDNPEPGSGFHVINFEIGEESQVSRWMSLN